MKIEVVPRFRIDGKYYSAEELPEKEIKEILENRMDMAMASLKYEREKTA